MPSDKLNNYIREITEQGKENAKHIEVINGELNGVRENMVGIKVDVAWIKKLLFIGFGGLGGLITLIKLLGK